MVSSCSRGGLYVLFRVVEPSVVNHTSASRRKRMCACLACEAKVKLFGHQRTYERASAG